MITKLLLAAFLALSISLWGQGMSRPEVPKAIQAPASEELLLEAHAVGSQIYTCGKGADGKLAWTLKAPEAELRDQQGTVIGRHFAGPTWKHSDGSQVSGKAAARVDAPDSNSIPWLLVTAKGHSGDGILSRVSSIQRIHTQGGQPPSGEECNAAKQNAEVKSGYAADYFFYAPPK